MKITTDLKCSWPLTVSVRTVLLHSAKTHERPAKIHHEQQQLDPHEQSSGKNVFVLLEFVDAETKLWTRLQQRRRRRQQFAQEPKELETAKRHGRILWMETTVAVFSFVFVVIKNSLAENTKIGFVIGGQKVAFVVRQPRDAPAFAMDLALGRHSDLFSGSILVFATSA